MSTETDGSDGDSRAAGSLFRNWSLIATWIAVVADVKALVAAEIATAKLEVYSNLAFLARQLLKLFLAALLLLVVLVVAVVVLSILAIEHFGLLPGLGLVALGCALLAVLLALHGRRQLSRCRLVPADSIGRLGRDLRQLSGRKQSELVTEEARQRSGQEAR